MEILRNKTTFPSRGLHVHHCNRSWTFLLNMRTPHINGKPIEEHSREWFDKHHTFLDAQRTNISSSFFGTPRKQKSRSCTITDCSIRARYNYPTEPVPTKCRKHLLEGMVATVHRQKTGGHIYNTSQTAWEVGSGHKGDCALNVLINKGERKPGRCAFYADTSRPRPPAKQCVCTTFCKGCKVLVHKDCYWIYHEVVHGLRLDAVSWVQTLQAQSVSTPPCTDSSYTEGIEI